MCQVKPLDLVKCLSWHRLADQEDVNEYFLLWQLVPILTESLASTSRCMGPALAFPVI